MRPYITPERTLAGKTAFKYQCEGVVCGDLSRRFAGEMLTAYALPRGHSMRAAWELMFIFESALVADFSSACTQAVDWHEVGSLNIGLRR